MTEDTTQYITANRIHAVSIRDQGVGKALDTLRLAGRDFMLKFPSQEGNEEVYIATLLLDALAQSDRLPKQGINAVQVAYAVDTIKRKATAIVVDDNIRDAGSIRAAAEVLTGAFQLPDFTYQPAGPQEPRRYLPEIRYLPEVIELQRTVPARDLHYRWNNRPNPFLEETRAQAR